MIHRVISQSGTNLSRWQGYSRIWLCNILPTSQQSKERYLSFLIHIVSRRGMNELADSPAAGGRLYIITEIAAQSCPPLGIFDNFSLNVKRKEAGTQ